MERPQMLTIARPIEYLLSGISSTSAIITRFIRSVRVAHTDLAAVTRDLSDLRLTLELLRDEPAVPFELQAQMLLLLESCGNVLIRIDGILARCPEPAKWVESGRADISTCRRSLATFREALALALDVASLRALQDNTADADTIKDGITAEVKRLQQHAQSDNQVNGEAETVLSPYLELVSSCLHPPADRTAQEEAEARKRRRTAPETRKRSFEHIPSLPKADSDTKTAGPQPEEQPEPEMGPSAQPEPAVEPVVPWHPANNIALSYYTEEPASLSQAQGERRTSPGLPESPTLPPLDGHPSPIPQRSLPPPVIQPVWKHNRSFSMQSEPATSPQRFELESPAYSLDQAMGTSDGYFSSQPRVTSFSSHSSGGNSSGSIARASFNITPVSAYHPESFTGFHRRGASTPIQMSPMPSSPPPEYRRTWINAPSSGGQLTVPTPAKQNPHQPPIDITPKRHLTDKGKGPEVLHIDTSPTSCYVASKHGTKFVKIWSTSKNALHGTIKITAYYKPGVRSREYFIRSHAILSENATLIGIASHFGVTLEIYDFAKGGSGAKKVQVIEDAHRWAASQRDAFHNDYAGLAVYRPRFDRIDRYFLARHPGTKTPFREDPNHSIELLKADLPFLPKFPELAYSSDSPILVAAAGPRPGDPHTHTTILVAWHLKPVSDSKLHSQSPDQSSTSLPDEERHKPYRVCVPEYPALQTALPACLAAHGSTVVSVWMPASTSSEASNSTTTPLSQTSTTNSTTTTTTTTTTSRSTFSFTKSHKPTPSVSSTLSTQSAPDRLVLTWDLPTNTTKIFSIPPHAQASISPDCRRLAYCDIASNVFVIIDIPSQTEAWRWPDAAKKQGFTSFGQFEHLKGMTVFEFSSDGRMLVVGDEKGGVGCYEIGEGGLERFELGVGSEVAWVDVVDAEGGRGVGRVRRRAGLGLGVGSGMGMGSGNGMGVNVI